MEKAAYLEIRKQVGFRVDDRRTRFDLMVNASLMCLIFALYQLGIQMDTRFWIFATSPVIAILMYRSFTLFHEACHDLLSKNRKLNFFYGMILGPFCLLAFEPWRINHVEHHRWSGNIEKDPVMALLVVWPKMGTLAKNFLKWGWRSGAPILALVQHGVFWILSVKTLIERKESSRVLGSIAWTIGFWVLTLALLPKTFFLWALAPALVMYLLGVEVMNLPHHLELEYHSGETRLPFWLQYSTCRSCIYPKWIAKNIVLNFNYHIEHHMYPDAPWYYLPKLHQKIAPMLQKKYTMDPQFEWIKNAKQKPLGALLQARMVSTPEVRSDAV